MIGDRLALPDTGLLRRVAREPVLLVGGPRALLLQIAHPKVAAGVHAWSNFRASPLRRFLATLDALIVVVYGRPDEARALLARIQAKHARVVGVLDDPPPAFAGSPRYSAMDPELALWVLATLADTTEVIYRRWVHPLDDRERALLFDDWRRVGALFGIPESHLPESAAAMDRFVRATLEGDHLTVTPAAIEIARGILHPSAPLVPDALADPFRCLTAGLLPERLRRDFGLPWGRRERALFAACDAALRHGWSHVPSLRHRVPEAWLALRRGLRLAG